MYLLSQRPKVDFEAVEGLYTHLAKLYEAEIITDEEFDDKLKWLVVEDQRGRWWRMTRASGQWHYYNGQTGVWGSLSGGQSPVEFSNEASKKSAEERVEELEQGYAVVLDAQERAAYFGDIAQFER